jgi:diguanylate cyclase (GGDEF)-like protein
VKHTESDRVAALRELDVMDAGPQPDLDAVVTLASAAIGVAGVAVNFIDDTRQHQAATTLAEALHCSREDALCTVVVETGRAAHTTDAPHDPRLAGRPLVTGDRPAVVTWASSPVRGPGGVVVGTVCVFDAESRELTPGQLALLDLAADQVTRLMELRRAAHDLQLLALHDELTGLPNRRSLPGLLDGPAPAAGAAAPPRTVAFLDLDGFKAVNDVGGHDVGDALLQVVALRLRAAVRPGDVVARLGGDEFVVVCRDVTDADELAGRLRAVADEPVVLDGRAWSVGVSVGVVTAGPAEPFEDALLRADALMYAEKRARPAEAAPSR